MLVVTRKQGETIHVSGPCEITVVEARPGKPRIGVQADKSVTILRGELVERAALAPPAEVPPAAIVPVAGESTFTN